MGVWEYGSEFDNVFEKHSLLKYFKFHSHTPILPYFPSLLSKS